MKFVLDLPRGERPVPAERWTDPTQVAEALACPALVPTTWVAKQFSGEQEEIPLLLGLQGTLHAAHRRAVAAAFSRKSVAMWEPWLANAAASALSGLDDVGPVPIGERFARPFALHAALTFIGIPEVPEAALAGELGATIMSSATFVRRRILSAAKLSRMLAELLQLDLAPDGTAHPPSLFALRDDAPEVDLVAAAMAMLTVGVELTARATLAVIVKLSADDDPAGRVAALDDSVIDTTIALTAIIPRIERMAQQTCPVGSKRVTEGDVVEVSLMPPEGLDPEWKPLPFGFGQHYCLGASWVRNVCRVGASSFFATYPHPRVVGTTYAGDDSVPGGLLEAALALA